MNGPREAAGRGRIVLTVAYMVLVTLAALHALVQVWPAASEAVRPDLLRERQTQQQESAERLEVATAQQEDSVAPGAADRAPPAAAVDARVSTTGQCSIFQLWLGNPARSCNGETLLLWVTILVGAIGALIHAWSSLATYIGNRTYVASWTLWYCARPLIGAMLAVLFYVVIRGGFLGTSVDTSNLNLYSFAALAGLVGMFSKQAADKLEEVFSVLFKSGAGKGDDERVDKPVDTTSGAGESFSIVLTPSAVRKGESSDIAITGEGLSAASRVFVDDVLREATQAGDGTLTIRITAEDTKTEGDRHIRVTASEQDDAPFAVASLRVIA